jgi:hypothetical protein
MKLQKHESKHTLGDTKFELCMKANIANRVVRDMLVTIVDETNAQRDPTALPAIIGF